MSLLIGNITADILTKTQNLADTLKNLQELVLGLSKQEDMNNTLASELRVNIEKYNTNVKKFLDEKSQFEIDKLNYGQKFEKNLMLEEAIRIGREALGKQKIEWEKQLAEIKIEFKEYSLKIENQKAEIKTKQDENYKHEQLIIEREKRILQEITISRERKKMLDIREEKIINAERKNSDLLLTAES